MPGRRTKPLLKALGYRQVQIKIPRRLPRAEVTLSAYRSWDATHQAQMQTARQRESWLEEAIKGMVLKIRRGGKREAQMRRRLEWKAKGPMRAVQLMRAEERIMHDLLIHARNARLRSELEERSESLCQTAKRA